MAARESKMPAKNNSNNEDSDDDYATVGASVGPETDHPRVGGVIGGDMWTGGSNFQDKQRKRPKTIFARRPDDFKGASKIEETCVRGLASDKRLTMRGAPVSLTSWLTMMQALVEDCGMDTVFRIPQSSFGARSNNENALTTTTTSTSTSNKHYMLEEWGGAPRSQLTPGCRGSGPPE